MKKSLILIGFWLPPLALMGLIFYLSSRPAFAVSPNDWLNFIVFKSLHFLEYAFLFILLYRAFKNTINGPSPFLWSVLAAFFWAVTDEIHQLYVPTRQGHPRDIAIDFLGILFGLVCLWIILPKAPKRLQLWAKKLALI
ncbi:MAG: VanZ family protein [Candidatus Shapirobacteria bacterium]|nr:VanZ family protein [Candidatus Shapirobacteria bacterium]MDD5074108.1 VanZ family protein [Candidatus Shapirobacteria bacterium]MDD5481867.1 VanZ family protein [Candidatus Shapirobacteria bacterium]